MKQKKYIANYDHIILFIFFFLILSGLFTQLNISSIRSDMSFFYKQTIWFVLSLFSLWFAFKVVSIDFLRKINFAFILVTIFLLILVLIIGRNVKGGVRSIPFHGINIQPSIFAKIVLVFYFAHILDKKQKDIPISTPKNFLKKFHSLIVIPLIMFILILAGRHFSILIISGLTLISMLFLVKIKYSTIFSIIGILLLIGFLVLKLGPGFREVRMKIYAQYSLFHKYLNIDKEYHGTKDYQVKESLISLGGGRIFGTTPQKGTGKHYFIPDVTTDYVFSIIGEEFGFLGALLIISAYLFFLLRIFFSLNMENSLFLKLLGYGLGLNIFFNAMVNIGVAMSALPSTGVTLPFISYGGTSLLVNSFSVGLILNIGAKRRTI